MTNNNDEIQGEKMLLANEQDIGKKIEAVASLYDLSVLLSELNNHYTSILVNVMRFNQRYIVHIGSLTLNVLLNSDISEVVSESLTLPKRIFRLDSKGQVNLLSILHSFANR